MLPTGFPQDLLTRTCTRSCKDTGRISPGPLQELLTRTCIRSCKGLWQHLIRISTRSSAAARADLTRSWCKNLPRASHKSFHTSTSNREEFSRISTRARLCENFQWKNEKSSPGALKDSQKTRQYFCQGQVPKTRFSTLSKRGPISPNTAPATKKRPPRAPIMLTHCPRLPTF